jgi:hypothetical protein
VLCCGVGAVCAKQVGGTATTSQQQQQPCEDSSALHQWSSARCTVQLWCSACTACSQLSNEDTCCLAGAVSLNGCRHASCHVRWQTAILAWCAFSQLLPLLLLALLLQRLMHLQELALLLPV